jgi:hypothetical protein
MLFTIGAIMPPLSRSPRIIPYQNSASTWPRSNQTGGDVSLFGIGFGADIETVRMRERLTRRIEVEPE